MIGYKEAMLGTAPVSAYFRKTVTLERRFLNYIIEKDLPMKSRLIKFALLMTVLAALISCEWLFNSKGKITITNEASYKIIARCDGQTKEVNSGSSATFSIYWDGLSSKTFTLEVCDYAWEYFLDSESVTLSNGEHETFSFE